MALAIRSLRFVFLTLGVFVFTACDRQATTQAPSQSTPATAAPATEPSGPVAIAAAVANPARPADDIAHDADRKPAETLTFFEVKPGEVVFEFVAGGGYFTELLSRTVGDTGRVVATREDAKRIADGRLPNVTAADDRDWGLAPDSVDLIFTAQNYHDVVNLKVERPPLLKNFLTILKPGGIFAVIDHSAEAGSGDRDVGTLASHRRSDGGIGNQSGRIRTRRYERPSAKPERRTHARGVRSGNPRQNRSVRPEVPQARRLISRRHNAQVRNCSRRAARTRWSRIRVLAETSGTTAGRRPVHLASDAPRSSRWVHGQVRRQCLARPPVCGTTRRRPALESAASGATVDHAARRARDRQHVRAVSVAALRCRSLIRRDTHRSATKTVCI